VIKYVTICVFEWVFLPLVSYRVVAEIAVNSDSVTLGNLMPNTQYQVTVTAFKAGRRFRSRPVIFKTLGKLDQNIMFNVWNNTIFK